jgi:pilus assembly protein TadC
MLIDKFSKKLLVVSLAIFFSLGIYSVQAFCPVCAVTIGAGVGLSQYLGVDDTITGLWAGALIMTMIIWTIEWLNAKKIHFKGRIILTTIIYYLVSLAPLYKEKIIGHPLNKLWGIDKLLLGTIIGSFILPLAITYSDWLKKNNNNKVYVPFQKVIVPVVSLIIVSGYFYLVTH